MGPPEIHVDLSIAGLMEPDPFHQAEVFLERTDIRAVALPLNSHGIIFSMSVL